MKFLYVVIALVIVSGATVTTAYSIDYEIPTWTKNVALYWGQGHIDDGEYINFLQFLVDEEIITIPNDNSDDISQLENKVASLESEISSLKSSIASDLKNAYDDGYSAGIAEQSSSSNSSSSVSESTSDPISLITFTNPQIICDPSPPFNCNTFGNSLNTFSVDQQIQLAADLTNGQDREQSFAYILEFKNDDGTMAQDPKWITGSLDSGQSFSPALSWIPTQSGTYIAVFSIYETTNEFVIGSNTKLAPSLTTQIIVQGSPETRNIGAVAESGFSQSCVETGCYTPSNLSANVGDTIIMTNTDPTGVHTFTSGTVDGFTPSPDGTFDTGVLISEDAFEWTPTEADTVPYYCMLHTWMNGTITVN